MLRSFNIFFIFYKQAYSYRSDFSSCYIMYIILFILYHTSQRKKTRNIDILNTRFCRCELCIQELQTYVKYLSLCSNINSTVIALKWLGIAICNITIELIITRYQKPENSIQTSAKESDDWRRRLIQVTHLIRLNTVPDYNNLTTYSLLGLPRACPEVCGCQ